MPDTWEWTADVDATCHEFGDTCPNARGGGRAEKILCEIVRLFPNQAYVASASYVRLGEVSIRAKDAEVRNSGGRT